MNNNVKIIKVRAERISWKRKITTYHHSDFYDEITVKTYHKMVMHFSTPFDFNNGAYEDDTGLHSFIPDSTTEYYYDYIPSHEMEDVVVDETTEFLRFLNSKSVYKTTFIEGDESECPYTCESCGEMPLKYSVRNKDFIVKSSIKEIVAFFEYCCSHLTFCYMDVIAERLYSENLQLFNQLSLRILKYLFIKAPSSWSDEDTPSGYSYNIASIVNHVYELQPHVLWDFLIENQIFDYVKSYCCFGIVSTCNPSYIKFIPYEFKNRLELFHDECFNVIKYRKESSEEAEFINRVDSYLELVKAEIRSHIV